MPFFKVARGGGGGWGVGGVSAIALLQFAKGRKRATAIGSLGSKLLGQKTHGQRKGKPRPYILGCISLAPWSQPKCTLDMQITKGSNMPNLPRRRRAGAQRQSSCLAWQQAQVLFPAAQVQGSEVEGDLKGHHVPNPWGAASSLSSLGASLQWPDVVENDSLCVPAHVLA